MSLLLKNDFLQHKSDLKLQLGLIQYLEFSLDLSALLELPTDTCYNCCLMQLLLLKYQWILLRFDCCGAIIYSYLEQIK